MQSIASVARRPRAASQSRTRRSSFARHRTTTSIIRAAAHAAAFCVLATGRLAAQAPPQFASLVLGEQNTCGLTAEGVAYCWGDNSFGQLGDGTTERRTVPTPVDGDLRFRLLSIGGTVEEPTDPLGRQVEDLKGVHVCGISTDSTAYCWGADGLGQVGAGRSQTEPRKTPTRVLTEARFATLTTNLGQSCAATAQGLAYCWGTPGFRLEEGVTVQFYSTPFALPAALQIGAFFLDDFQICGLTADGAGVCWRGGEQRGGVHFREIKIPDAPLRSLTPTRARLGTGYCGLDENHVWLCWNLISVGGGQVLTSVPKEEVPGVSFTAVRAHGDMRCGLATTGTLYCRVAGDSMASPLLGDTLASLVDSASGICGLRADGGGRCVGRMSSAASNGASTHSVGFAPVPGDFKWRTLHVGPTHSCGITVDRVTYCWGENRSGQLGDGSRRRRTDPVEVRTR